MTDVHTSGGAYVSDALDSSERDDFEAHLTECALCRQEVAEFDETLAEFARMAAVSPPRALRTQVLAGIAELRPLPPAPVDDPSVRPEPPSTIPPLGLQRVRTRGSRSDTPPDAAPQRRQWWRTRALIMAIAATTVIAVGLGGWVYSLSQQQQMTRAAQSATAADAQRERELLTAPDARLVSARRGESVYSFVVSRERDEALFLGTDLSDPGAGKTYQLWTVVGSGPPAPNALTVPDGSGRAQTWLRGSVGDTAAFAVSIEPAAGSKTPTADQIQALVKL